MPTVSRAHAYSNVIRRLPAYCTISRSECEGRDSLGAIGDDGMFSHRARSLSCPSFSSFSFFVPAAAMVESADFGSEVIGCTEDEDEDAIIAWGGVRGSSAGRSARAATSSRERWREGLWRMWRAGWQCASPSCSRSCLRDMEEPTDVDQSSECVRVRARTVWMVFPDASEKGEDGGRRDVGDDCGCECQCDGDGDGGSNGPG